ncbi:hypothetical protein [Bradyrhizobium sp. DOA1]|uniref:hypothetical protein n=1 Tax=Bradyrhizobium sp. DOA1 TaxID=1126616 RepID=UPI00077C42C5|nr:hypothetical protein [Bradyrhizobium sp. DOA1]KYG98444.1 hypothetical protein SE91_07915 [Bradyrhizobium sp. DOA1]
MPGGNTRLRNIHDEIAAIARQNTFVRALIARSCEILKQPVPDTFLGRKTHEPFPEALSSEPDGER